MNKLLLLGMATLALLAAAVTSFAQNCPAAGPAWTSPGSAGATIDPMGGGLNKYDIDPRPCLTFKPAQTGRIVARYDVVNTAVPSTATPPWTIFEMGYSMPPNTNVTATLYRVFRCTGQAQVICTINGQLGQNCSCCFFPPNSFNYLTELYMVEVTLSRPPGADLPRVCTLRVYPQG